MNRRGAEGAETGGEEEKEEFIWSYAVEVLSLVVAG